jgi:hypothetical protein
MSVQVQKCLSYKCENTVYAKGKGRNKTWFCIKCRASRDKLQVCCLSCGKIFETEVYTKKFCCNLCRLAYGGLCAR